MHLTDSLGLKKMLRARKRSCTLFRRNVSLRSRFLLIKIIHHFHIAHNTSRLPPKILHLVTIVYNFSWVFPVVPREIEDNVYAKFWGKTRCTMGNVKNWLMGIR